MLSNSVSKWIIFDKNTCSASARGPDYPTKKFSNGPERRMSIGMPQTVPWLAGAWWCSADSVMNRAWALLDTVSEPLGLQEVGWSGWLGKVLEGGVRSSAV